MLNVFLLQVLKLGVPLHLKHVLLFAVVAHSYKQANCAQIASALSYCPLCYIKCWDQSWVRETARKVIRGGGYVMRRGSRITDVINWVSLLKQAASNRKLIWATCIHISCPGEYWESMFCAFVCIIKAFPRDLAVQFALHLLVETFRFYVLYVLSRVNMTFFVLLSVINFLY